jgi:DNA-binding SARP family transcriptional activator
MSIMRVHLLGRFVVQYEPAAPIELESRKAQELFGYLLLHRNRCHSRELLASLLWDDVSTAQSRTYLRKALWKLQTTLDHAQAAGSLMLVDDDWIQINPAADLWLDVAHLQEVFARAEGIAGEHLDSECAQALEQAVGLYQGDLLDGWYQDWCLFERERLQNIYLALLDKLMGYCEAHGAYERGIGHGAQVLRYDRAHEQTHRRLMRLYYLADNRTAALRQFERCRLALDEELGVAPVEATIAVYEQIKANRLDVPAHDILPVHSDVAIQLRDTLDRLNQMRDMLAAFQERIQQDIHLVEQICAHYR